MSSWLVPMPAEEAFAEIWKIHPELQNHMSSAWWFFLLLPEQEKGFGPKQMMFSYASRAGKKIAVRDKWQKGFDINTVKQAEGKAEFMTTVVGWVNDGEEVHEEIVHQGAKAFLDPKGKLEAFNLVDGEKLGAVIKTSESREMGIDAHFIGRNGFADFEVWSDPNNPEEHPQITDIQPGFFANYFNVNLVAWRKINFKGTFKTPAGTEEMSGIGYFQRVLFNGPLIPWIWIWAVFEDKSVFSTFIPYAGLHNIRRADRHFGDWAENRLFKIKPTAYFIREGETQQEVLFTKVNLKIENDGKPFTKSLPKVKLIVSNDKGDHLRIFVKAHAHAQFHLDRAVIHQFWMSRWNYNEYPVKIQGIVGKINGERIRTNMEGLGQGWGNMEYAFGMSL